MIPDALLGSQRKHIPTTLIFGSAPYSSFSLSSLTFQGSPLYCCHIAKVKQELLGNLGFSLHYHRWTYRVFICCFGRGHFSVVSVHSYTLAIGLFPVSLALYCPIMAHASSISIFMSLWLYRKFTDNLIIVFFSKH